jgi:tetratricopeptide (TPR) repeat protein
MRVAVKSGDPIGQIAAGWLQDHPDHTLALSLAPDIPHPTTALRELAEVVDSILYAATVGGEDEAVRAARANNRSVRLSELGRREEALESACEAVDIRRALVEARPSAFHPDLAGFLNNLANRLSNLGHREEALQRAREAVELYRAMAEARPDAFRPDLAMSLNTLANRLSDLGHREEALQQSREAVGLYRALAEARPDAFRPDLANSLGTLTSCLTASDYREEALQSVHDGVAILQPLFLTSPRAFALRMAKLVTLYGSLVEELGTESDAALLAPIVSAFEALKSAPKPATTNE